MDLVPLKSNPKESTTKIEKSYFVYTEMYAGRPIVKTIFRQREVRNISNSNLKMI